MNLPTPQSVQKEEDFERNTSMATLTDIYEDYGLAGIQTHLRECLYKAERISASVREETETKARDSERNRVYAAMRGVGYRTEPVSKLLKEWANISALQKL